MQKLTERHGQAPTVRALRYTSIRLKSQDATKPLAEKALDQRKLLQGKHEVYLDAVEERVAATAVITYLDGLVDGTVQDISRSLLVEVQGDRSAPKYRRLFPASPSSLTSSVGGENQENFVNTLLSTIESDDDYASLRPQAEILSQHQTALQTAFQERKNCYIKESQATIEWQICKDETQRFYNLLYHQLQLMFPNSPTLVESFFAKLQNPSTKGPSGNNNNE